MSAERRILHRWLRQHHPDRLPADTAWQVRRSYFAQVVVRKTRLLSRTDRVVAAARMIIALAGLLSLELYLPKSAEHAYVIFWIATPYFVYSAVVATFVLFIRTTPLPLGLVAHVVDVLASAALMNLGEVADTPFFAFLTFPLLSASFQWGWRGILWTSLSLVVLYAASSVVWPTVLEAEFDPTGFGVHSAHVLAVGAMLALFSLQQRRFGDELIRLGTWPAAASTANQMVSGFLEYAAKVFDAPRVILVRRPDPHHAPSSRHH